MPTTPSPDAFEAKDPAEAIQHALNLAKQGKVPSFFLESDDGPLPPEIRELLNTIHDIHVNIGSQSDNGRHIQSESIQLTPFITVDGQKQIPVDMESILNSNKHNLSKVLETGLQKRIKVVVDETTERHQDWLEKVIEKKPDQKE